MRRPAKRLTYRQRMNRAVLIACGLFFLAGGILFACAVPFVKGEVAALIGVLMSGGFLMAAGCAFAEVPNV